MWVCYLPVYEFIFIMRQDSFDSLLRFLCAIINELAELASRNQINQFYWS